MTLEELEKNWKEYALRFDESGEVIPLERMFKICMGKFEGGLLFDQGGKRGDIAAIFKTDASDNCFQKINAKDKSGDKWELVGKFLKLKPPRKKRSKK